MITLPHVLITRLYTLGEMQNNRGDHYLRKYKWTSTKAHYKLPSPNLQHGIGGIVFIDYSLLRIASIQ